MTDWCVRKIEERPEVNDHRNSEYDLSILDRLGRFHERAKALKDDMEEGKREKTKHKHLSLIHI